MSRGGQDATAMDLISPYLLSFLLALPTIVLVMGMFSRRGKFVVEGRTVVLTGGSQGMGRGLAKIFAQKGANVILVARDVEKLEAAIKYISAVAAKPDVQRFHYISADVTSSSENERIIKEATAWNNGLPPDIVWANAGGAHPSLFLDTSIETMRKQMDLNFWSAAYLAHATLRTWLYPSRDGHRDSFTAETRAEPLPRHFIMTSSVVCFVGIAGYAPYAPGKSALRSLADTLRSEINLYNGARQHSSSPSSSRQPETKIHIVLPGTIISPGLETENESKHPVTRILEEGDPSQSEDEVAEAAIRGLEKGDYMITTQFLGSAMRVSMLGGSPRCGLLGIRDALFSCVTAFVWLFISPDMENKVWKWGKANGVNDGAVRGGKGEAI